MSDSVTHMPSAITGAWNRSPRRTNPGVFGLVGGGGPAPLSLSAPRTPSAFPRCTLGPSTSQQACEPRRKRGHELVPAAHESRDRVVLPLLGGVGIPSQAPAEGDQAKNSEVHSGGGDGTPRVPLPQSAPAGLEVGAGKPERRNRHEHGREGERHIEHR